MSGCRAESRGFTLIELLLSVTIITLIAGFSLPFYLSFQTRNDLDVTTNMTVDMLRRAQNYARNANEDSQWGVAVQSGSATLYRGTTYATRDTTDDETITIPGTITPSGLSEVSFVKFTGVPGATGSFTLANANNTRTITLNAKGMVSY